MPYLCRKTNSNSGAGHAIVVSTHRAGNIFRGSSDMPYVVMAPIIRYVMVYVMSVFTLVGAAQWRTRFILGLPLTVLLS